LATLQGTHHHTTRSSFIHACGTYGASSVSYSAEAEAAIAKFTAMGFDKLPICMAKTQYSFSHDATLKGECCLEVLSVLW
jgi:formyltetrahydrofolate synthetase